MTDNSNNGNKLTAKGFLRDMLAGFLMGIAFIIPGFSGGSIAAIVGIYEKLICAVTDIFKDFKNSIKTLLPIGIGLVLGAVSLLFPLKLALEAAPLPTVSLFVGLALGGMFSITDRLRGRVSVTNVLALSLPLILAAALCFIPTGADVDLFALDFGGYVLLFLVGVLGSVALVVPGISGSMLLLILGYYNPIVRLVTDHLLQFKDIGTSVLVLGVTAVGIALGFLIISVVMKWLLKRYPRGTYFAIVGFIVGSIPAVYTSTMGEEGFVLPTSPWHYVICAVTLAIGFVGALLFVLKMKRIEREKDADAAE